MKRHFPPLRALRAFEATGRLLSFQQAAKELHVTHSAVSHQIKKLEQELGKPLFERLGRSIALTEVGSEYYIEIHEALNRIESSTYRLFGDPDKGDLIVQVYMSIASRWLVPRLGHFREQYPDIHIELNSSYYGWDFEPSAADIGIVYSEDTEPGLAYQPLFKGALVPVCSPSLLGDAGVSSLQELLKKPFLVITESPQNLPAWLQAQGVADDQVNIVSEHDNPLLAIEAAIAGQGVVIVHSFFASGDIANNKLVIPLDLPVPEIGEWYLVQPSKNLADSKVNCFANWLYHQISADQTLQRSN